MLLNQSSLVGKARKEAPSDAQAPSHVLLTRAGYIDQLGSGLFSLLPLGWRVHRKIEGIIRSAMEGLGAQEVLLPALQPASLWAESGRLETADPPLFRVKDRHDKELVLASTHEEAISDIVRKNVSSYKELPFALWQIQTKFRNEVRSTGGLLRVREFFMKDLYSFHRTKEDLQAYYERVQEAYFGIFKACDLTVHKLQATSGTIGGKVSHEFSVEAPTGEDMMAICKKCGQAFNVEVLGSQSTCPACGGEIELKKGIEAGHTFQLGTVYSEPLGVIYTEEDGSKHPMLMGCYGIGLGRLLAAIVETHHDEKGIWWPKSVSPFRVHVLALQKSVLAQAQAYATQLSQKVDVLFDDRQVSPGQKLAEADLLGITERVVISEKTQAEQKVEVSQRGKNTPTLIDPAEFLHAL